MWFLVLCAWLGCGTATATFVHEPNELTGLASVVSILVYLVAAKMWFVAIDHDWEVQQFTEKAQQVGLAARSV